MAFLEQMRASEPSAAERRRRTWIFIPYDRVNDGIGPLAKLDPQDAGIILIESHAKGRNRPYHKKKVLVVLSNMRHFALEQQARGVAVIYRNGPESYGEQLRNLQRDLQLPSIQLAIPAERELLKDLQQWQSQDLELSFSPDDAWLSTDADWTAVFGDEPAVSPGDRTGRGQRQLLMERFYR